MDMDVVGGDTGKSGEAVPDDAIPALRIVLLGMLGSWHSIKFKLHNASGMHLTLNLNHVAGYY